MLTELLRQTTEITPNAGEDVETLDLLYIAGKRVNCKATPENSLTVQKLNTHLTYGPAMTILDISAIEKSVICPHETCT